MTYNSYPPLLLQPELFQCTVQLIPLVLLAWWEFLNPPPTTALLSEAEQLVGEGIAMIKATNKSENVVDDDRGAAFCWAVWKMRPVRGADSVTKHVFSHCSSNVQSSAISSCTV